MGASATPLGAPLCFAEQQQKEVQPQLFVDTSILQYVHGMLELLLF